MPQGTRLGPLTFVMYIDDLNSANRKPHPSFRMALMSTTLLTSNSDFKVTILFDVK